MHSTRVVMKSVTRRLAAAPAESTASLGEKRVSSLSVWSSAKSGKSAAQNSPVETSQKAAPPRRPSSQRAQR